MKKIKRLLGILLIGGMLFTSCSKSEDLPTPVQQPQTVNVINMDTTQYVDTIYFSLHGSNIGFGYSPTIITTGNMFDVNPLSFSAIALRVGDTFNVHCEGDLVLPFTQNFELQISRRSNIGNMEYYYGTITNTTGVNHSVLNYSFTQN